MLALTYHQVMQAYLDFIFPFGIQENAEDFHFSGFRQKTRLSQGDQALSIPMLARSGRGLQICYNLKAVEESRNPKWSIRQTAVYHSFDVETGCTIWIMVKGSNLMKRRVMHEMQSSNHSDLSSFQNTLCAFAASLAAHVLLCDWSGENWRWFINSLEEDCRRKTRDAVQAEVDRPHSLVDRPQDGISTSQPRSNTFPSLIRQLTDSITSANPMRIFRLRRSNAVNTPTFTTQNNVTSSRFMLESLPEKPAPVFAVRDLQDIQSLEDQANNALLVLKMNSTILSKLKQLYRSVVDSDELSDELRRNCKGEVSRFEQRVSEFMDDLQVQQSRLKTLLRMLSDRKNLVSYSFLEER